MLSTRTAIRPPAMLHIPLSILALVVAWLLIATPEAGAHTLSISRAKAAVSAVARELARADGLTTGTARNCSRVNAHRVTCEAVTQGFESSLGAVATCTRTATARYRPHKRGRRRQSRTVLVAVNSSYKCKYDYGTGGDGTGGGGGGTGGGGVPAPPAPDTTITGGPEEGSSVAAEAPVGPPIVFLHFDFAAIGGEDPIFECSIDGAPFLPCAPGGTQVVQGLGTHTFQVRAVSIRLGAVVTPDPTPAQRTFTVVPAPPLP
jgi:hypothetical protein